MEIKIELLTYEKGNENKENIAQMMQVLDVMYDEAYCVQKTNDLLSFLADGSAIVASAFLDDILIGYAWGYLRNLKVLRMHITQFVVNEKYRSMGIGKQLLDFLQTECEKRGCVGLELNVTGSNSAAQKFYHNNNFVCESMFMVREISKESVK